MCFFFSLASKANSSSLDSYRQGYSDCVTDVSTFFNRTESVNSAAKTKILGLLSNRIQELGASSRDENDRLRASLAERPYPRRVLSEHFLGGQNTPSTSSIHKSSRHSSRKLFAHPINSSARSTDNYPVDSNVAQSATVTTTTLHERLASESDGYESFVKTENFANIRLNTSAGTGLDGSSHVTTSQITPSIVESSHPIDINANRLLVDNNAIRQMAPPPRAVSPDNVWRPW